MTGLGHEKFEDALKAAATAVGYRETELTAARSELQRIARAAHAVGMTEREIAKITGRSGPAVHAWLHKRVDG